MSWELIFFSKKKLVLINLAFFSFFVYLLSGFINERSHNTLLVFREGAMELILMAKVRLYGFESVFWQNLTDFLFVVYSLFFL